jgi:hypothetical protein
MPGPNSCPLTSPIPFVVDGGPRPTFGTNHYLGENHDQLLSQLYISDPTSTTTAEHSNEMIDSLLLVIRLVQEYAHRLWSVVDT